jgi:hypothetical protein
MGFRPDLWGIETEAEQLVSRLTRTLPVTAACVALWDQPSLTLTVRAVHTVHPVNGSLLVGARVALSDSTWRRIVLAPSEPDPPESGDDRRLDPEREAELALMPQVRSMYLLPIRFAGETVGVLALGEDRSAEREPFSSEKRRRCQEILEEFVATTAPAWEARRLHRQARAMSSLMRLVRGVSAARSFDDVLASLAAEVVDWLGIRVRGVLLGTAGKEIKLLARWQLPDDILGDGGRQLFLAMTRSGARGTGPIAVAVAGDDPLDPLTSVEPAAKNWTRIGVPLMKDERLVGLACLYLEEEIGLADWELEALGRRGEIAALGVVAVETALTVEAEQKRLRQVAFELLTGDRRALLQEVFGTLTRTLTVSVERRLREALPELVDRSQSVGVTADADRPDLVTAVVSEVAAACADLWEPNGQSESLTMSLDVNDIVGRALRVAKTSPGRSVPAAGGEDRGSLRSLEPTGRGPGIPRPGRGAPARDRERRRIDA